MWTLIIFAIFHSGYAGGMSATNVQGFTSKLNCEKAGYELTTNTAHRQFYNQYVGTFTNKIKLDSTEILSSAVRYSFECVEVK